MKTIMFPGQGSQYRGMGKSLFPKYKQETDLASEILGYDLEELCVKDPKKRLGKTQFTQPALYVVNALLYYEAKQKLSPDYLIGHSLGEYNALYAAGAFDFETGLCLVKKRGELMAAASGGGMAAVLGIDASKLEHKLREGGYTEIDVANFNTPTQIVVSGPENAIIKLVKDFESQDIKIIPLFVTAPFHSRYMEKAAKEFDLFLKEFDFSPLKIPVIANSIALPYEDDKVSNLLSQQIASPVRWTDTIRLLMGKGVEDYKEIGSEILSKMVTEIQENCTPIIEEKVAKTVKNEKTLKKIDVSTSTLETEEKPQDKDKEQSNCLGSKAFLDTYNVKYTYVSGSMYRGIASKELVVRMGKAKMLGFLGTGGMAFQEIEDSIHFIQSELSKGEAYGMNLIHDLLDPAAEMETVKLFIKNGIKIIEASAFMKITPALVYYRLKGLRKDKDGKVICDHKVMAKISRPEVAKVFMRPAPERIVNKLLDEGLISADEASMAKRVPMSYDICAEADSGGHTDGGIAMVLLPSIQALRTEIQNEFSYQESIRVGLAGGIGTPQAVACAFIMGADFVVTGSINQCTVEAGISDVVKDLLQEINVQDTDYAPAGDMFEIGAQVQVLKKGVLFSVRANKLYKLYEQYNALDQIPEKTIEQLEKSYFKKPISEVWEETKEHWMNKGNQSFIEEAERNPKKKMGLVFRWYFWYSMSLSFDADSGTNEKVNFQVHTGPALGAFNQWVKGTNLENWKNRHADTIGIKMMEEAVKIMKTNLTMMSY